MHIPQNAPINIQRLPTSKLSKNSNVFMLKVPSMTKDRNITNATNAAVINMPIAAPNIIPNNPLNMELTILFRILILGLSHILVSKSRKMARKVGNAPT